MSLSLKEILIQMAHTVGRAHLIEHIEALPLSGADANGETESEKLAKRNPLTADEAALLAKLQDRQNANDAAVKEDAADHTPTADGEQKSDAINATLAEGGNS
jgi:hypothetical protein